jgi:hypothetical protein
MREAKFTRSGGGVGEEFTDHFGVAVAMGGEIRKVQLRLRGSHGGFGGAFDFQEGAEVGEGIEFDETIGEAPGVAVLFEEEELHEAQGGEQGDDLAGRGEVEVEGFTGAQAGGGGGAFEGQQGLLRLAGGGGKADAEAGVGAAEGAVGAVEEDVGFAHEAKGDRTEGGQAGADPVMRVKFELNFDFQRHSAHQPERGG